MSDEFNEQADSPEEVVQDRQDNKLMAVIAYLGILFIVPLLAAKNSRFAMYHANQGIILSIVTFGLYIIGSIIPIIGWLLILPLATLFWFIWAIIGIINAANEREKSLPLIGGFNILNIDKE